MYKLDVIIAVASAIVSYCCNNLRSCKRLHCSNAVANFEKRRAQNKIFYIKNVLNFFFKQPRCSWRWENACWLTFQFYFSLNFL